MPSPPTTPPTPPGRWGRSSTNESIVCDSFSSATKLLVKSIGGDECWACGSQPVDIAHVVAKEDPAIPLLTQCALINFSLMSPQNAIALCPTCRHHYDLAIDPGLVFYPTDLKFFIEFEKNDRARRRLEAQEGLVSQRQFPTAEIYRDHQANQGLIPPDAQGGLFQYLFLTSYLHTGVPVPWGEYFSQPRIWHGAPMAALRRAFVALGSARIGAMSRETMTDLERLRNLYFLDEGEHILTEQSDLPSPGPGAGRRGKRDNDNISRNPSKKLKETGRRKLGQQHRRASKNSKTTPPSVNKHISDWILGPDSSSEDAISRFRPILLGSRSDQ